MDIMTILSQIDLGSYALPVFQRGYVWNREQVRRLMNSLYRGYPIGGLLVWNTTTDSTIARGDGPLSAGNVNLILDGQQRITTLYGIIRGKQPMFFEGNAASFTNLYFNLEDETFEFYMPAKMKDNRAWISVTDLMKDGAGTFFQKKMQQDPDNISFWMKHFERISLLDNVKKTDLHIEVVSGEDKTIDVVVEIFNNVNTGGTKLSKGDLALAKICSEWPEAREELKKILKKYQNAGYDFKIDWLLRCLTVYLTGQAYFNPLSKIPIEEVKKGVKATDAMIGTCLDHIGSRLGLDHDRVLGGIFAIPTMIGYIRYRGGKLTDCKEWDKLLYWYVHSFLWGRYAGSTESTLSQDLNMINQNGGIDGLIMTIKQNRGDLTIRPQDFWGWSTGARFYPLLYLLTRTRHAVDWGTGVELSHNLLGKNSTLDVHHIFPKAILYANQKSKAIVNSLANYAFLTKDTNLEISDTEPAVYMPKYQERHPGALESHWIPMDPELWKVEHYEEFLQKRRELLADAANTLLTSLYGGHLAQSSIENYSTKTYHSTSTDEDEEITELTAWLTARGMTEGVTNYPLLDQNEKIETIIDLAWPQGIQDGLSEPIALLLNETAETQAIVSRHGYRYFTTTDDLKAYIEKSNML